MNQGHSKSAVQQWQQTSLQQVDIYYDMPLTWKEKETQRKLLLRNKRIQNYCFTIEAVLVIAILWLIVPTVIERFL